MAAGYRELDALNLCSGTSGDINQNNTAGSVISACFENTGFSTVDAQIDNLGKTGLALAPTATSPAVAWRLPTIYDYEIAEVHGIRFVMPDMGSSATGQEWMATTYSTDKNKAWTFASNTGLHAVKNRDLTALVRCVGR